MTFLLLLTATVTAPAPVLAAAAPVPVAPVDLSAPPSPHAPMRVVPRLVPSQAKALIAARPVNRSARPRWSVAD